MIKESHSEIFRVRFFVLYINQQKFPAQTVRGILELEIGLEPTTSDCS